MKSILYTSLFTKKTSLAIIDQIFQAMTSRFVLLQLTILSLLLITAVNSKPDVAPCTSPTQNPEDCDLFR